LKIKKTKKEYNNDLSRMKERIQIKNIFGMSRKSAGTISKNTTP